MHHSGEDNKKLKLRKLEKLNIEVILEILTRHHVPIGGQHKDRKSALNFQVRSVTNFGQLTTE